MLQDQVTVDSGGRFVIPAALRQAMNIKPNDKLNIKFDDGELRLTSNQQVLKKLQDIMRPYKDKPSMVDDFLAHRKEMWGEE